MNNQVAPIRIKVDVTNPGQFFACCGLMELADRMSPSGVEGWFEHGEFCLQSSSSLPELMEKLFAIEPNLMEEPAAGIQADKRIAPLKLPMNGTDALMLDAWTRWEVERRKPKLGSDSYWKFWSGNQGVLTIWQSLRDELGEQLKERVFADSSLFEHKRFMKGRFGFDAQAAWNALDAGYSPNDQVQPVATSPALELLALVGLQRFRPGMMDGFRFEYSTWAVPMQVVSARAASCGVFRLPPAVRLRATVIRRGKYGGLSYATKISGDMA